MAFSHRSIFGHGPPTWPLFIVFPSGIPQTNSSPTMDKIKKWLFNWDKCPTLLHAVADRRWRALRQHYEPCLNAWRNRIRILAWIGTFGIPSAYPCRRRYALKTPMIETRGTEVKEQYAEWLQGYRWDDFLTVTFRQSRKEPYYALRHVGNALRNSHNVARAFLVAEPHQSGDLHIHGIIAGSEVQGRGFYGVEGNNMDTPTGIWGDMFRRFGRSKVEPCKNHEAVSMYCSKYILKQQSRVCDYYEVIGNKLAWERGRL